MDRADQTTSQEQKYDPAASLTRRKRHFLRKREIAQRMRDKGFTSQAQQLDYCSEYTTILACGNCGHTQRVVCHCRLRICPLCSYQESKKRADYLLAMTKQMKFPKLLTFTMPLWKEEPQKGIKQLRVFFAKLRKQAVFAPVKGGAYQIEVKIKPAGFHIHLHTLVDAPFIPYQRLFSAWRNITGVNVPQIDIRAADTDSARVYAAKYASKASDFDADQDTVVAWYEATKGQRLFATFGRWYNKTLEEIDPEQAKFVPSVVCPQCGMEHSMYFARDGPFLFDPDTWRSIASKICPGGKLYFPIDLVQQIIGPNDERSEA